MICVIDICNFKKLLIGYGVHAHFKAMHFFKNNIWMPTENFSNQITWWRDRSTNFFRLVCILLQVDLEKSLNGSICKNERKKQRHGFWFSLLWVLFKGFDWLLRCFGAFEIVLIRDNKINWKSRPIEKVSSPLVGEFRATAERQFRTNFIFLLPVLVNSYFSKCSIRDSGRAN